MESLTNKSALSATSGLSSASSSSSRYGSRSSSRDWTTSGGTKTDSKQDVLRDMTQKKGADTSLLMESPKEKKEDKELNLSAKTATVGVIAVLVLSMLMLMLHISRMYLDTPVNTEKIFDNFSRIVVPEVVASRTPVSWPTFKPLPVRPPRTEADISTTEQPTLSESVDLLFTSAETIGSSLTTSLRLDVTAVEPYVEELTSDSSNSSIGSFTTGISTEASTTDSMMTRSSNVTMDSITEESSADVPAMEPKSALSTSEVPTGPSTVKHESTKQASALTANISTMEPKVTLPTAGASPETSTMKTKATVPTAEVTTVSLAAESTTNTSTVGPSTTEALTEVSINELEESDTNSTANVLTSRQETGSTMESTADTATS